MIVNFQVEIHEQTNSQYPLSIALINQNKFIGYGNLLHGLAWNADGPNNKILKRINAIFVEKLLLHYPLLDSSNYFTTVQEINSQFELVRVLHYLH